MELPEELISIIGLNLLLPDVHKLFGINKEFYSKDRSFFWKEYGPKYFYIPSEISSKKNIVEIYQCIKRLNKANTYPMKTTMDILSHLYINNFIDEHKFIKFYKTICHHYQWGHGVFPITFISIRNEISGLQEFNREKTIKSIDEITKWLRIYYPECYNIPDDITTIEDDYKRLVSRPTIYIHYKGNKTINIDRTAAMIINTMMIFPQYHTCKILSKLDFESSNLTMNLLKS